MSYDHWKTTNPADEWLGPEPEEATMTRRELNIHHLKRSIEHCVSLIAICRVQGNVNAEASYEERLARLNAELEELQNGMDGSTVA